MDDKRIAVVVGSGPSLADFDFEKLRDPGLWVIGINREPFIRDTSLYDAWIYSDAWFSDEYGKRDLSGVMVFETHALDGEPLNDHRSWASDSYLFDQGYMRSEKPDRFRGHVDWSYEKDSLFTLGTTATAAINLVLKLGFRKVALLGLDLAHGKDGQQYYSDRDPGRYGHNFSKMMSGIEFLASSIDQIPNTHIVNCSEFSFIDCWPKMGFDQCLKYLTTI